MKFKVFLFLKICNNHHHHHHVALSPRISLATLLSRPLLPAGLQDYILYRCRAVVCSSWSSCLACSCEGVHRSMSLMSSPLLLQQCPAFLVRLILIVFVMGGKIVVQLLLCGLLLPGLVQYCLQHSIVVAVKLFLHTFS